MLQLEVLILELGALMMCDDDRRASNMQDEEPNDKPHESVNGTSVFALCPPPLYLCSLLSYLCSLLSAFVYLVALALPHSLSIYLLTWLTVNGLPSGAVSVSEVPPLKHETWNHLFSAQTHQRKAHTLEVNNHETCILAKRERKRVLRISTVCFSLSIF